MLFKVARLLQSPLPPFFILEGKNKVVDNIILVQCLKYYYVLSCLFPSSPSPYLNVLCQEFE